MSLNNILLKKFMLIIPETQYTVTRFRSQVIAMSWSFWKYKRDYHC